MPIKFLHKTFGIGKRELPVLIFALFTILFFGVSFLEPLNYEFIIYTFEVIIFLWIILESNKKVKYPTSLLWFLAICVFLHLAGGSITIEGGKLYDLILLPLSDTYPVLRYDHVTHMFGFFTATLLAYSIIRNKITKKKIDIGLSIILVLCGLGFGCLNEIVEFIVSQTVEDNLVGGYINIGLDLIANLIGSVFAVVYIKLFLERWEEREKKLKSISEK